MTIRTPCPLIGFCLYMARYQRAQPRHFKQGRKINPPKKELLVSKPPPQRGHVCHPLSKRIALPPTTDVTGTCGLPFEGENQKSLAKEGQIKPKSIVNTVG